MTTPHTHYLQELMGWMLLLVCCYASCAQGAGCCADSAGGCTQHQLQPFREKRMAAVLGVLVAVEPDELAHELAAVGPATDGLARTLAALLDDAAVADSIDAVVLPYELAFDEFAVELTADVLPYGVLPSLCLLLSLGMLLLDNKRSLPSACWM
jgi:hypothetical protein